MFDIFYQRDYNNSLVFLLYKNYVSINIQNNE